MAAALDPAAFNKDSPQAFYMLDSRADMEVTADATLVVAGKRLPVHSQVLSLQSRVLRGLFSDLLGGVQAGRESDSDSDGGSQDSGAIGNLPLVVRKRKAALVEGLSLVLEAPFQESTLFDTALFLRFCYHLEDRTPANLAAVLSGLSGLLRLAHKLDAPQIQQAVCECMADKLLSATLPELLEWVEAADRCQLPELRLRCLSEVARRLASGPGGLADAFADTALVAERCDKRALQQLLGIMTAAVTADRLSSTEVTAAALQQAANHGSFEWALERYSQQPSGIGQFVNSPWFEAAGKDWCFQVYPGGVNEEAAGHLSALICCAQPGTRAKWSVTLVDQAAEGRKDMSQDSNEPKTFEGGWGWAEFATHERLRSRPGYLAGDRLVLRARVEVVP